jgi:alpha-L-arabinofuranosidase
VHHYASDIGKGKVHALQFDSELWYALLRECDQTEKIIQDQWAVMGQYDNAHRVKLVVDEYGPWYLEGTELHPEHIFGQQITMRDALATALTLDIFNRNSDKVVIATNAQLINNINALFLAHEDQFIVTPNFHVFDLYSAHQGGQTLRTEFTSPHVAYQHNGGPHSLWGLNGSASRKGSTVTLTVVNTNISSPSQTQIHVRDGNCAKATAIVLTASDIHAHNTFADPNAVQTASLTVSKEENLLNVALPPASVTRISISLV